MTGPHLLAQGSMSLFAVEAVQIQSRINLEGALAQPLRSPPVQSGDATSGGGRLRIGEGHQYRCGGQHGCDFAAGRRRCLLPAAGFGYGGFHRLRIGLGLGSLRPTALLILQPFGRRRQGSHGLRHASPQVGVIPVAGPAFRFAGRARHALSPRRSHPARHGRPCHPPSRYAGDAGHVPP